MTGVELIAAERRRQFDVHHWDESHDDCHRNGELARAGACYAVAHLPRLRRRPTFPWKTWWKPKPHDPVRNLVKAGALIAAEIDRLQRLNP